VIQLKSAREIDLMAQGGQILARTVEMLRGAVHPGMSTLDLDKLAEDFIRGHEGATPAFKGLYGFPGSICSSLNNEIVHGIPSARRVLKEGDVISIDVGVGYKGYFTDSATTVPVGQVSYEATRLLDVTQRALDAGIAAAVIGNHIGDIGAAVQAVVKPRASVSSATWSVTASASSSTRSRRSRTTENPSAARSSCRTDHRHRTDGEHRRAGDEDAVDAGRSSRSTGRCRRTSSTPSRSPRMGTRVLTRLDDVAPAAAA
jgi:methionine aminopeptidase